MIQLLPGQPIEISDKRLQTRFSGQVCDVIDDLEHQAQPLFGDIRSWWDQYEAIPKLSQKDWPFVNASNIIVPLGKIHIDAIVARLFSFIFAGGHRVWESRTENEGNEDIGRQYVRYQNWQADDNDFDLQEATLDWLYELVVIGGGVLAGNWREDRNFAYVRQGKGKSLKVVAQEVLTRRGPNIEHLPREFCLWDYRHRIDAAPAIIREYAASWTSLVSMANSSPGWYLENLEKVQHDGGATGPSEDVRVAKAKHDSMQKKANRMDSDLDIRECHLTRPMMAQLGIGMDDLVLPEDRDAKNPPPEIPIVATIHRKQRTLLRLIAAPYHAPYPPFFDGYYRKRPGRGHGVGAMKDLEGLQSGITTITNQAIDAQTRANSIWAKTRDNRHQDQPFDPRSPIYDPTDSLQPFGVEGSSFSNIQLNLHFRTFAQEITGQSDAQFGRETRMGGHPSPATNFIGMAQSSDTLIEPLKRRVNRTLSRVGEFVAILNQQFEPSPDRVNQILGQLDGEKVNSFIFPEIPIPTNYIFNVRGLSRELNPDARVNQATHRWNLNAQYWQLITQATASLAQLLGQQLPDVIRGRLTQQYITALMSTNQVYKDLLDAADVDDTERYMFSVEHFTQQSSEDLRAFTGQGRDLQPPGVRANGSGQAAPGAGFAGLPGGMGPETGDV